MAESIQYGGRTVAGNFIASIQGAQALGRAALRVHLLGTVYEGVGEKGVVITPLCGSVSDGRSHLAALFPVTTDLRSGNSDSENMRITFQGDLEMPQVRLLDETRELDGTRPLSVICRFLLDGKTGSEVHDASFHLRVTAEEWRRVICEMKFEERATFDVPIAGGQVGPPFDTAANHLRTALEQRDKREAKNALGECRDVLQALEKIGGVPPAPIRGEWGEKLKREAWSLDTRIAFLRDAAEHVTHASHHAGIGAASLKEAHLITAVTALLLRFYSEK